MRNLLLFSLLFVLFSCNNQEEVIQKHNSLFPAIGVVGTIQKPPTTVSLNNAPKPQEVSTPPEVKPAGFYYFMHNYTANDGLALDEILSSIIDRTGNLWFGTYGGGVSRYDGHSFTTYPFAGGVIWSILEDRAGNIWLGSEDGVSKYDGSSFTQYSTVQGLANDFVRDILEDKSGVFWFATGGGVSKYDAGTFTNYDISQGLANNTVWSVIEDRKGNLWFGTEGGASRFDGKTFTNYTTQQGLIHNLVREIHEDEKGNLWFCTAGGISKYDGKSFVNYTQEQGLADNNVWAVFEDRDGKLWFGTDGGLSRYDGNSFVNFTTSNGLASNFVKSIVEDKAGNLWISTQSGGVSRFDGEAFRNYRTAQGLVNANVRGIAKDRDGNFWFSTMSGVSKYDGKTFTNYTTAQGLPNNQVRGILVDKSGTLWFGTEGGGVSKFDEKSFETYTTAQGLPNDAVRFILEDKAGNFWFATFGGGVSKFDGKSFTNYSTAQGLINNSVRDILEDRSGNLWFSTDKGISKFDGKTFTNFTKKQGLGDDYVMSIFEDNAGNLWMNTVAGLSRYDGKSFLTYTTAHGLPEDHTYRTIAMQQGFLLVGTNRGIAILKGYKSASEESGIPAQNSLTNEELEKYQPVFEVYNAKNGYPVADLNSGQSSIYLDTDGIIWFGTGSEKIGLVRFDYDALHKNPEPLDVFIQGVKIDNEDVIWYDLQNTNPVIESNVTPPNIVEEVFKFGRVLSDEEREMMRNKFGNITFTDITKFYYVPEELHLPHSHNNITFHFAAVEPDRPQSVMYQYMLEGYDNDWGPLSNDTRATFGNIFEGTYHFRIKVRSPYGIWTEPVTYTFEVLAPWYRTWLAYVIYAVSAISIIYLIFLWRTAVLRQRYEQLQVLYRATERFVPKAFFNILKKEHIQDVQLGESSELEVTAMFSDIRGYTSIMEKQTPQEAFAFINAYLKVMAPIIRAHDGFIISFMGDGIMALFPKHPEDGIKAVMAMDKALITYNLEQAKKSHIEINVGYGLNTGRAMVGIVGEEERMAANVIGDTINLASRIESLNKFYGTEFLASEGTIKGLKDSSEYIFRLVDKVMVKGKKNPIYLYEIGFGEGFDADKKNFNQIYEKAFRDYEKGLFPNALAGFQESLKYQPDNRSAMLFIERCEKLLLQPVPAGWNGVYEMTHK